MAAPSSYTRIVLAERPKEHIVPDVTFKSTTLSYSDLKPAAGEVVVKINYLSLDPAMRGWLNDKRSYIPPVQIGEVMRAGAVGTVVSVGESTKLSAGDLVSGTLGWQEYALVKEKDVQKIQVPPKAKALDFLGPLGMTGLTAYFGLLDVGQIKAGETLVVSGAAGATGSLVCQIGKIKGAKVVGIAGGADKCRYLKETLGVDVALDYKSPTFHEDARKVGYLDVYFDNVGGEILDFLLTRLNKDARIVLCGAISDYNNPNPKGLKNYLNLIAQRGRIQGFIVFDYSKQFSTAIKDMAGWIAEGKLNQQYHVVEGLAAAPSALPMLFSGGNTGKLVVKVAEPQLQSKL